MYELINNNKAVIQVLHRNQPIQPLLEFGSVSFSKGGYLNLVIEGDNAHKLAQEAIEKIRRSYIVVM